MMASALQGAFWGMLAIASLHPLQVLSPVAGTPACGLAASIAAATWFARKRRWDPSPRQRTLLWVLAGLLLPGLLDRDLYPWFSARLFWPVGWILALAPWAAALPFPGGAIAPTAGGAAAGALLLRAFPSLATRLWPLALVLSALLLALSRRPWKPRALLVPMAALSLFALNDPLRLAAGSGERVAQLAQGLGRTLAVVQAAGAADIALRDGYHQVLVSSAGARPMRREGLLGFRLHPAPKRTLVLGAANPYLASVVLEHEPDRLTWVDPEENLFSVGRWWISRAAAANTRTLSERAIASFDAYLASSTDYFDVAIVSAQAPWSGPGAAALRSDLPARIRERLYPDGIAIQWVLLHQWTEPRLAELVRRWRGAFDGRVELWRADLSPDFPAVALVARGRTAPPEQAANPAIQLQDAILGLHGPSYSLRLASAEQLRAAFPESAPSGGWIGNPWLNALARADGSLGPEWLVQKFGAVLRGTNGPPEGGILYTEAWLARENEPRNGRWKQLRAQALRLLGYDPSDLYPEMDDRSERVAAPDRER